jgi:outer membrane immunogenic protein
MVRKVPLTAVAVITIAVAGSASAADLPSRKTPALPYAAPVPIFTWTGFYLGAHVGYEWQNISETGMFSGSPLYTSTYGARGMTGGGHAGYNWQVNQFVFGLEGDLDATSLRGTSGYNSFFSPAPLNYATWRSDFGGSIRGRLGVPFDRLLLYGTGGVALMNFRLQENFPLAGISEGYNSTRAGYTIGAGVEYAFTNKWVGRVEYRYSDFGSHDNASALASGLVYRERVRDSRVITGLSYKFDFAPSTPLVARY